MHPLTPAEELLRGWLYSQGDEASIVQEWVDGRRFMPNIYAADPLKVLKSLEAKQFAKCVDGEWRVTTPELEQREAAPQLKLFI
jgi:hypothetical protein